MLVFQLSVTAAVQEYSLAPLGWRSKIKLHSLTTEREYYRNFGLNKPFFQLLTRLCIIATLPALENSRRPSLRAPSIVWDGLGHHPNLVLQNQHPSASPETCFQDRREGVRQCPKRRNKLLAIRLARDDRSKREGPVSARSSSDPVGAQSAKKPKALLRDLAF